MTYEEMKANYKFTLKNYPSVSALFENKNIICTTTREMKNGSRWISSSATEEVIDYEFYFNCLESIPLFRRLGTERVKKAYTHFGYIPVRLISTSPDGTERTIREFKF